MLDDLIMLFRLGLFLLEEDLIVAFNAFDGDFSILIGFELVNFLRVDLMLLNNR